jgi:hypothetical protein
VGYSQLAAAACSAVLSEFAQAPSSIVSAAKRSAYIVLCMKSTLYRSTRQDRPSSLIDSEFAIREGDATSTFIDKVLSI